VIHIEDIRVKKKDRVILDAIHLTVQKGEKVLLTGIIFLACPLIHLRGIGTGTPERLALLNV
jgi:hypothetical protein